MKDEGLKMYNYHLSNDKTKVLGKMRNQNKTDFCSHHVFDTKEVWISMYILGCLGPMRDFSVSRAKSVENYKLKLCLHK